MTTDNPKRQPRGIRNNNPGNIKSDGTHWQGLDHPATDGTFCRFKKPVFGIRAMARILITYQDKRRAKNGSAIDTVDEIVDRWAPPSDNNPTESYKQFVCDQLGIARGEIIDIHEYQTARALVEALIKFENGQQPYSDNQIRKGLLLAGIEADKPITKSRTAAAATTAAGVTGLGAVLEHAETFSELTPLIEQFAQWGPYILAAVGIAACAWIVKIRWDDGRG